MDQKTNGSLCSEDAKRILQAYYLFILLLFFATIPHCSMLYFELKGFFVKIFIYDNSWQYVHFTFRCDIDASSKFICNFGFYITSNVHPNFGEGLDGQVIKKRLKVFETKSLKHKDSSLRGKLRFFYDKPIYIWGGSSTPTAWVLQILLCVF